MQIGPLVSATLMFGGSLLSPGFMQGMSTPEGITPPDIPEIAPAPPPPPPAPEPASPAPEPRAEPKPAPERRPQPTGVSSILACIRHFESRGDYSATNPSGKYRGAYQFDRSTWRSVGGSGDPARASRAEQDHRAALLYKSRGLSPWPTPSKRCR